MKRAIFLSDSDLAYVKDCVNDRVGNCLDLAELDIASQDKIDLSWTASEGQRILDYLEAMT